MTAIADTSGGNVISYRSPRLRDEWTAHIGMFVFLGSWAMMFAAFFFVYGGIRSKMAVWPPMDLPPLPVGHGTLSTGLALLSSAAFVFGVRALRCGESRKFQLGLIGTTLLGTGFLVSQGVLWSHLYNAGLTPASGTYGASVFSLTVLHAAHVVVGVVALAYLSVRALGGHYTPARYLTIRLWSMYWHFVGVVWVFLFMTVFVL